MKANLKRVLSFAMALMLVLSIVPTMAFAAENDSVAYAAENTSTGMQYADLNAAIADAQAGQIVKVLADAQDVTYANAGVILDLNGHDLTVTVAEGVTLSAIDSATDDYEGEYGSVTTNGNVASTVKTTGEVKSYVTVAENGSYSFHRYYAAIAAISLKPNQVALGYRAEFRGDETVKNAVVNYGYELWTNGGAHKTYSRTDALEASSLTLRLKNILVAGNDALNAFGSTAVIGGNAFVTLELNGEQVTLYGTEQETTLRQVVESVNANAAGYGEAQLESVRTMCTTYAAWMEGWNTDAIFGKGDAEGDDNGLDVEITVDVVAQDNVLTQDATLSHNDVTVTVPQGTTLTDGTQQLVLTITEKDASDSNVAQEEGHTLLPLDVHIEGIAADNTTPIIVCLGKVLPQGLNIGNYKLYHVENGETVEMTRVYFPSELDAHNEFYYAPATGAVTVALASFSEITLTANEENPWDGAADTEWYNNTDNTFTIYNAQQLAGLGQLVDSGNTFDGKTIILGYDINLYGMDENDERRSFNPIGYGYDIVFKGTFDGNGHTIRNLYQNGWALGLSYSTAGGGLFASVVDADFRNLFIDGAEIVMECIDMGTLVGYAYGDCSFTNIVVSNTVVANYNRYTGGVVGEVNGDHTFYNVDVTDTTTLSALWGTFDPSIGGIIGGKYGDATVYMEKCDVACKLDVFNDVTSAYQWYSYRRCGMLIGLTEQTRTDEGRTTAMADFLKTKDCTVVYGDWAKYHYCLFSNTTSLGGRYPWVRVEEGLYNDACSNPRYGHPIVNDTPMTIEHTEEDHLPGDNHMMEATFHQLYGGGQGCYGGNWHIGDGVTEYVTYEDGKQPPEYVQKFVPLSNNGRAVISGTTLKLNQLFKAANVTPAIQNMDVHIYVSPVVAGANVGATINKSTYNWMESTLTFYGEGKATITITDYYYCVPTVLTISIKNGAVVVDKTNEEILTENADKGTVFTYTAETAGTLHISMGQCDPGWQYQITYPDGTVSNKLGAYSAGTEYSTHSTAAGTWKVTIYAYSQGINYGGTVSYKIYFAADDPDDAIVKEHHKESTHLVVGSNTLSLLEDAETTLYRFSPTPGIYRISGQNGVQVENWGNNAGFLVDPNNPVDSFEWTCNSQGQNLFVGVSDVQGEFVINVELLQVIEPEPEPDPDPSEPTDPSEPDPSEPTEPDPSDPTDPPESGDKVVTVSDSGELGTALSNATAGTTIKLTDDITTSLTVESGKDIILDLNGYTLSANKSSGGVITVNGTLTIQDSSAEGDGMIQNTSTSSDRGIVVSSGQLIVKSGNITTKTQGIRVDSGSVTIEGGSISATNYGIYAGGTSVVTISGGTIQSEVGSFYYTVYGSSNTNVTITGGYFNGSAPGGGGLVTNVSGTTYGHISGGYFTDELLSGNLLAEGYVIVNSDISEYTIMVVKSEEA